MPALIALLRAFFNVIYLFLVDIVLSIIDYIKDLPVNSLKAGSTLITKTLDWAGSYCSYCLGGTTIDGAVSAVSVFATQLKSAYNALSPCVIYALTQSGIVGDLQILSCAMVVWSAFRVVALVKTLRK
ncbi:hypothetical protein [Methylobacter sp.]|uniref:hypothetical protein n=1 Tax=Methylobacter sp. TaxID=2051955 RepID=UPI0024873FA5|nr:hypothetical protein [Methylobacter sp.]MDI1278640.1 hypothetical protein [Methylobacter sp.]MDI1359460.1 hypothetical protein [Methylobacter sp.]